MEEEEVLKYAKASLSLEWKSRLHPEQSNHDTFRKNVSSPILEVFSMSKHVSSKRAWRNGVNFAVQMQAMFKAQSRARLESPRYAQLLK